MLGETIVDALNEGKTIGLCGLMKSGKTSVVRTISQYPDAAGRQACTLTVSTMDPSFFTPERFSYTE